MSIVQETGQRDAEPTPAPSFWLHIFCWLSGYHFDPALTSDNRCKRCHRKVRI